MKRSFHVLLSPEGIWTTCLSLALSESGDKTICHPFLAGYVWFELTSKTWFLMSSWETAFRFMRFVCVGESEPFLFLLIEF